MPEQLSQSQIDALLKKMSSGEADIQEDTKKAREYDFKSPKDTGVRLQIPQKVHQGAAEIPGQPA